MNINFVYVPTPDKYNIDPRTQNFIDAIFPPALRGTSGQVTAEILRGLAHGRN